MRFLLTFFFIILQFSFLGLIVDNDTGIHRYIQYIGWSMQSQPVHLLEKFEKNAKFLGKFY